MMFVGKWQLQRNCAASPWGELLLAAANIFRMRLASLAFVSIIGPFRGREITFRMRLASLAFVSTVGHQVDDRQSIIEAVKF